MEAHYARIGNMLEAYSSYASALPSGGMKGIPFQEKVKSVTLVSIARQESYRGGELRGGSSTMNYIDHVSSDHVVTNTSL